MLNTDTKYIVPNVIQAMMISFRNIEPFKSLTIPHEHFYDISSPWYLWMQKFPKSESKHDDVNDQLSPPCYFQVL